MAEGGLSADGLVTAMAALLAIAVAVIGILTQRRIHKREQTLEMLAHLLTTDQLIDGRNVLRRLRNSGASLSAQSVSPEEMDRVNAALQYYEFVARAYFRGDLDRATVEEQLGGSYLLAQSVIGEHVAETRERFARPKLFEGIERMARDLKAQDAA